MGVNSSTAWLLAGALVVVLLVTARLLWLVLRRRPAPPQMRASAPLVCPTCRRGYPSGTQFCPLIVEAFEDLIDRGKIDDILGQRDEARVLREAS